MDIAVLSDIHSNYIALEECIHYAKDLGITKFLFLGDYASDCPYPQKTLQILYRLSEEYNCWFIRGNREDYMIDYRERKEEGWIPGSSSGCLLYTYSHLTGADIDFFESIPIHSKVELPGLSAFRCCHGSPSSSRELLYSDSEAARKVLEDIDCNLLICGHTHIQGSYEYLGKKLMNPGSVGIPWYHDGKAQFAILHGTEDGWEEEYIQLEYDRDRVYREFEASGLNTMAPMWSVIAREVIRTGRDVTVTVLNRSLELCREETGEAHWPYIPEKYWEQAVREQGIMI